MFRVDEHRQNTGIHPVPQHVFAPCFAPYSAPLSAPRCRPTTSSSSTTVRRHEERSHHRFSFLPPPAVVPAHPFLCPHPRPSVIVRMPRVSQRRTPSLPSSRVLLVVVSCASAWAFSSSVRSRRAFPSGMNLVSLDVSEDNGRVPRPGIVVFSGGTAFNAAASEMASREGTSGGIKVWHVLPVTDDGGSTAEIVRALGGPAVGDIRSRLLRLAPGTTEEARAVRRLLGHRLVSVESWKERNTGGGDDDVARTVSRLAREEWLDILDGGSESPYCRDGHEHPLWKGVSAPYRSIIRSFLVYFHDQVLRTHNGLRHSPSHPPFDFAGGSVGNFFFAGAVSVRDAPGLLPLPR